MSSPHKPTSTTPLDDLLYRPDIEVGARGDVIQFYNKVFLEYIKDFVLKFSPTDIEVRRGGVRGCVSKACTVEKLGD